MATLDEAERARAQKAKFLRQLGAHAIGVEPRASARATARRTTKTKSRQKGGEEDFVVIAYFDEEPKKPPPEHLEVRSGGRTLKVPLAVRRAARFQLE